MIIVKSEDKAFENFAVIFEDENLKLVGNAKTVGCKVDIKMNKDFAKFYKNNKDAELFIVDKDKSKVSVLFESKTKSFYINFVIETQDGKRYLFYKDLSEKKKERK